MKNEIRIVEGYDPYRRAIMLDSDVINEETGEVEQVPYLKVCDRLEWFHKFCEVNNVPVRGVVTAPVPELTAKGLITLKATVTIGDEVYTGIGTAMVDANEGLSGSDVENAETRAIGRALRNAGFASPADGNDEETPVDGAPPQSVQSRPLVVAPLTSGEIIDSLLEEENTEPIAQGAAPVENIPAPAKKPGRPKKVAVEEQLAEALKQTYPFNPWKGRAVYELLDQPKLKDNLTWIINNYSKEEVVSWAKMLAGYLFSTVEAERKTYLDAREILRNEGLIK